MYRGRLSGAVAGGHVGCDGTLVMTLYSALEVVVGCIVRAAWEKCEGGTSDSA